MVGAAQETLPPSPQVHEQMFPRTPPLQLQLQPLLLDLEQLVKGPVPARDGTLHVWVAGFGVPSLQLTS